MQVCNYIDFYGGYTNVYVFVTINIYIYYAGFGKYAIDFGSNVTILLTNKNYDLTKEITCVEKNNRVV